MVFIEAIVSQVDVRVTEILFCWLLIVFGTKSSKTLLIEIADIRLY